MSEPNEPNDTDLLADLLRAERERDELPEDRVDDAWNALDERLRALPPPPPPPVTGGLPTAAKVLGVLAVFGVGVLTGAWLERSRTPERDVAQAPVPSASTASVASIDTSAAVPPKPAPSLVPVEVTSLPLVSSARPAASAAPSVASAAPSVAPSGAASTSTDLADERSLVEGARVALLRGRPSDALGLATSHAKRFPRGELAEDRDFIRVRALRDLGRGEEARAEARAFLARYPKSGLRPAVAAVAE